MNAESVEPDVFLMEAGECFMFLLWTETTMRDFVVLEEGGEDMRLRYSEAFGKGPHPSDFSRCRLNLGKMDFGEVKNRYLGLWPKWTDDREVRDAIERVVIWRNVLGHANVQPFRGSLLHTPTESSWKRIRNHMKCPRCYRYLKDCGCRHKGVAEPRAVIVHRETLRTVYRDIRTVDVECFYPTAVSLNVAYRGVRWLTEDGGYMLKQHQRCFNPHPPL